MSFSYNIFTPENTRMFLRFSIYICTIVLLASVEKKMFDQS